MAQDPQGTNEFLMRAKNKNSQVEINFSMPLFLKLQVWKIENLLRVKLVARKVLVAQKGKVEIKQLFQ